MDPAILRQLNRVMALCLLLLALILRSQVSLAAESADPQVLPEKRLALVIGNGAYKTSPLRNPRNDANDMARVLRSLGFEVILEIDITRREMADAIAEFGNRLKQDKGVGLFYYAGHGVQLDNHNYLIPLGSSIRAEDEVPFESIDVERVLAKMQSAGNLLNVVLLDACRNNPFYNRYRSSSRGLARLEPPVGSLVVYATSPGQIADDGGGRNGLFTGQLLKFLAQPGLSLTQMVLRTRRAVWEATDGKQVPWDNSSLLRDVYLSPPSGTQLSDDQTDEGVPAKLQQDQLQQVRTPDATASGPFTLKVMPPDARVRIMNIREVYSPGMLLEYSREYDVDVSRSGYQTFRQSIKHRQGDDVRVVRLAPLPRLLQQSQPDSSDVRVAQSSSLQTKSISVAAPRMVRVTGGEFVMGCSAGDRFCSKSELPRRTVAIKSFDMSATEVTVEQFSRFASDTGYVTDAEKNAGGLDGCLIWLERDEINQSRAAWKWVAGTNWKDPGYVQTPQHPVSCISYNDARNYAQWLADGTGLAYRLPSEAEWEYAGRAGSIQRYFHGPSLRELCTYTNGADASASDTGSRWTGALDCLDGYWFSAPAASFRANSFGLYDMFGNVWEWVEDSWSDSLPESLHNGAPHTDGIAGYRVMRGGGWDSDHQALRVSNRNKGLQHGRAAMTGFRVVH